MFSLLQATALKDAAAWAVLAEQDGTSALKGQQITAPKSFLYS